MQATVKDNKNCSIVYLYIVERCYRSPGKFRGDPMSTLPAPTTQVNVNPATTTTGGITASLLSGLGWFRANPATVAVLVFSLFVIITASLALANLPSQSVAAVSRNVMIAQLVLSIVALIAAIAFIGYSYYRYRQRQNLQLLSQGGQLISAVPTPTVGFI